MQVRPLILCNARETVPGNEQFVSESISYHLQPNQARRHDDCVEPIDREIVHSLGPHKCISISIDKPAVGAQFCDGAAGLNSSESVALHMLLILDRY